MNTKLYANISYGHENDWETIEQRIISAAQCNADAIIISKTTPSAVIPQEKRYVAIGSKWGTLPYIEVAKKSEIDLENVKKLNDLTTHIGIPVIWSVTDIDAVGWVKENAVTDTVKIHYNYIDDWDLFRYCIENFENIIYGNNAEHIEHALQHYLKGHVARKRLTVYHAGRTMPTHVESLELSKIDELKTFRVDVGYEGRSEGIYPDCAVVFKGISFIEKFLGNDDETNPLVLTPSQFYDFFINMNQLEVANG